MSRMKLWFDTEFIEDGVTIDLLSIGIVREDGETYYAEPAEADRSRASDWVRENVLPFLTGPIKPRAQIAREIVEFAGKSPEWWAYYADYDWVVLCQLYGTMMHLPTGWPMYCRDVKQVAVEGGFDLSGVTYSGPEHNALTDALWTRDAWRLTVERQP
jgi:hypothetical protein